MVFSSRRLILRPRIRCLLLVDQRLIDQGAGFERAHSSEHGEDGGTQTDVARPTFPFLNFVTLFKFLMKLLCFPLDFPWQRRFKLLSAFLEIQLMNSLFAPFPQRAREHRGAR